MGGAAKSVTHAAKNAFSNPIRGLTAISTLGTSELARRTPIGNALYSLPEKASNGLLGTHYGQTGSPDIGGSGPFQVDAAQSTADQAAINALGEKQYADTLGAIDTNSAAQQKYAGDVINRSLPGIEETLNSQHLLNGSGLGQEVGRQATSYAQDLASQNATQKMGALTGKQGFQTGALQRGLSLEDFVNQANVAKTIGAQMAPPVPNGKGTAVSGLGAGATAGTAIMPGWGTAIGAGLGYLGGGGANGGRGK